MRDIRDRRLPRFVGLLLVLFSLDATTRTVVEPIRWVAVSKTAVSITGDARFTPTAIGFAGGRRLSIAFVKDVSGRVSYVGESHAKDHASLYRVLTPTDLLLLNHNALCGQKPTYVSVMMIRETSGGMAYLTVYSGTAQPTGSANDKICGGYSYSILP